MINLDRIRWLSKDFVSIYSSSNKMVHGLINVIDFESMNLVNVPGEVRGILHAIRAIWPTQPRDKGGILGRSR